MHVNFVIATENCWRVANEALMVSLRPKIQVNFVQGITPLVLLGSDDTTAKNYPGKLTCCKWATSYTKKDNDFGNSEHCKQKFVYAPANANVASLVEIDSMISQTETKF